MRPFLPCLALLPLVLPIPVAAPVRPAMYVSTPAPTEAEAQALHRRLMAERAARMARQAGLPAHPSDAQCRRLMDFSATPEVTGNGAEVMTPAENGCFDRALSELRGTGEVPYTLPGGGFVTPLGDGHYRLSR